METSVASDAGVRPAAASRAAMAAAVASLVPVVAGLAASAVLAVDYLQPAPVFCSEGGGCEAVRQTAFAAVLGVPTPLLGLVGFLALGVAALLPGRRARLAQLGLAVGASLVGALLLAAQWAMGHYCPYCCVADTSAVVSAFVAAWRFSIARDGATSPVLVYVGALSMVAAAVVPVGLGRWLAGRAPEVIRAASEGAAPGEVTVVDFVDFECPFCRMTHAELQPILDSHRDRVRVVRRQVPLRMHPHALDAARAACCGEALGKGEAMANALFTAPVEQLTREGCEKLAQTVGLSLDPYRACVADPKTDARIESDRTVFKQAGGYALPTIWIDGQQLVGAQPRAALEKVIGDALARAGS
jgi:uncharacterized membrane protein/predicted DsbA family dithiol-disulfide isomerase